MRSWGDERGESLVEVLMTVAILGMTMVALIAAIGTAVRSSDSARQEADAVVVVTRAAEAVKGVTGLTCASLSPSQFTDELAALADLPAGWTAADITVTTAECTPSGTGALLPRVVVEAVSPLGKGSESLVVAPRLAS